MHLYGEVLDNNVKRDLPTQTLDAIDLHVSNSLLHAHARKRNRGVYGLGAAGPAWTPRPRLAQ